MLDMNPEFRLALKLMENSKESLFITGKAGTGKSTLLDYFSQHTTQKPVILAPTGVAALNVGGQTIHSFFRFRLDVTPEKIKTLRVRKKEALLYRKIGMIIIDEISMLRCDLLDCIDRFLQIHGPSVGAPFGGVRMIFLGDLYQLPPVTPPEMRSIFSLHYQSPFFFDAHVCQDFFFRMVELKKVYRQKDDKFLTLLNRIRDNHIEKDDLAHLNERHFPHLADTGDSASVYLTTTNREADQINAMHLKALKGAPFHSTAEIEGEFSERFFPTAEHLTLKKGAQVMLLNNDQEKRWCNGSLGIVRSIVSQESQSYVRVFLQESNQVVKIQPFQWILFNFSLEDGALVSKEVGRFRQFPFRLAWGLTIHKSQGKSFDKIVVDIGRGIFEAGQLYVALSRCTSLEGIILKKPIGRRDVYTNPEISRFWAEQTRRENNSLLTREKKISLISEAIETERWLSIVYLTPHSSQEPFKIRPTSIEQVKSGQHLRWAVVAATHLPFFSTFLISRILEIKPLSPGEIPLQQRALSRGSSSSRTSRI